MNDNAEFSQLHSILESDSIGEDCLTFVEAHGYLTASIISPRQTLAKDLVEEIVGEEVTALSENDRQILQSQLQLLGQIIERQLMAGEALELPLLLDIEDEESVADLEDWCFSFMEKHLAEENAWFAEGGDDIAQMLLPVVAASGILEDKEINEIRGDEALFLDMIADIPELMIDLYVIFHESQVDEA